MRRAAAGACAVRAPLWDAGRLGRQKDGNPELLLIHDGSNHPYKQQAEATARARRTGIPQLDPARPFVLHVGSNLRMKNREGALRIFARTKNDWNGQLVFSGQKLTPELRSLGDELGVLERVVAVAGPDNRLL